MARSRAEDAMQKALVQHLKLRAVPGLLSFAPVNEGKRSPRAGARLKAMGMLVGISDLVVIHPLNGPHFLELKTEDGTQSPQQIAFEARCKASGWPYEIARSLDEALSILRRWGCLSQRLRFQARAAA